MTTPKTILAALLTFFPLSLPAENKHIPPPAFESTLPWIIDLDEALQ